MFWWRKIRLSVDATTFVVTFRLVKFTGVLNIALVITKICQHAQKTYWKRNVCDVNCQKCLPGTRRQQFSLGLGGPGPSNVKSDLDENPRRPFDRRISTYGSPTLASQNVYNECRNFKQDLKIDLINTVMYFSFVLVWLWLHLNSVFKIMTKSPFTRATFEKSKEVNELA